MIFLLFIYIRLILKILWTDTQAPDLRCFLFMQSTPLCLSQNIEAFEMAHLENVHDFKPVTVLITEKNGEEGKVTGVSR